MAQQPDTIHIAEDSELAALLEHVDGASLRLESHGMIYRVTREANATDSYDPEKVRAAVQAAAGMLTPIQGEALKSYLYRARQEGTRPADRP
jgi:hypothetical protein